MKFRVARHTSNLEPIIAFYRDIIGFEVLGSFNDHDHYDGVFLGFPGEHWHLEFTVSDQKPEHHPDADDLLVFYPVSQEEYQWLLDRIKAAGIVEVEPANPYWKENGLTIHDPDGYGIVIAKV